MLVYASLLLSLTIIYPLFRKKRTLIKGEVTTLNSKKYVIIVSLMLIVIAGFRGLSVGIDTYNYFNIFNQINMLDFSEIFIGAEVEHGYVLFQYLVGQIFGEFKILLIIVAALYIGMISYYIYKYSSNPLMSYILFVGFGFYTFGMTGIRQTIAMAFILIAFRYIKEKNIFKFLFFTIVASMFHIAALIFIPSYWFNKFKFNKKTIILFVAIALVVIGLKEEIRGILNSLARLEYSAIKTGGNRMYFIMIVSTLLGVIYRKPFIAQNEDNKYFFYMMVASTMIMPITQFNPTAMRLYFYFFIFMIIYIPNILSVINDRMIRLIGITGYALTAIIWFFTSTIYTAQLEKYMFFWQ